MAAATTSSSWTSVPVRSRLTPTHAAALADRHTGIGCDQLIVLEPGDADAFMRIYNPDGSEAGACGNATRCVADILMRETGRNEVTIRTISGDLPAIRRPDGVIEVDMGPARLDWADIPLARPMDTLRLDLPGEPAAVSMGNPHATFFVADLDSIADRGPGWSTIRFFRSAPISASPRSSIPAPSGSASGNAAPA